MGDMGDVFRAWGKAKQEKRRHNREQSADLLVERGYSFESRNGGAHLIVAAANGALIDFWPGTGRWIVRRSQGGHAIAGRGVHKLMSQFPAKGADHE